MDDFSFAVNDQLNKLNIIVSLQVALLSVRLQVGLQLYCD